MARNPKHLLLLVAPTVLVLLTTACALRSSRDMPLSTERVEFAKRCIPVSPLLPADSVDPSLFPVSLLETIKLHSVAEAGATLLEVPSLEGHDLVFMRACHADGLDCFERLVQSPLTWEGRLEPGRSYRIDLRLCVREDRAHVKQDEARQQAPEGQGPDLYCSRVRTLSYQHELRHSSADSRNVWQRRMKREAELYRTLTKIQQRIANYLNTGEASSVAFQQQLRPIIALRDNFYSLAMGPTYDIAYASLAHHLARTSPASAHVPGPSLALWGRPIRKGQPTGEQAYCAQPEDIEGSEHLLSHPHDLQRAVTMHNAEPSVPAHLRPRLASYALLALGGVVPMVAREHLALPFPFLQDSLFTSLRALAPVNSPASLPSALLDDRPELGLPRHPMLWAVGARYIADYDQRLQAEGHRDLSLDSEKILYQQLYNDLDALAVSFHELRQGSLSP